MAAEARGATWQDAHLRAEAQRQVRRSDLRIDQIQPAVLCLFLYKETGTAKYKTAADYILSYLAKQPKNASGGFWHKETYPNQMWTDGIYMAEPVVSKYGFRIGSAGYCDSIATFQPALLYSHAYNATSKLLVHAWDETKKAVWADATTGLSPCVWSRGMGWYAAGMVDILKYLPKSHPQYNAMLTMLGNIAEGIKNAQDPTTGLWYQVTDKGSQSGNFVESSGSGLFIFALKTAVDYGFIDKSYLAVAQKGWTGFKTKLTLDAQGLPVINGFIGAMSAGVLADYIAAPLVACPPSTAPHGYCAALYAASAMELQTAPKYRLTISVAGQGSVSNPTGEMFLDSGSTVTLTATPNSGYHCQWSGDASGSSVTASIAMNAEKNVTATSTQGSSILNSGLGKANNAVSFKLTRDGAVMTFTALTSKKVGVEIYNCDGYKVKEYSSDGFQPGNHAVDLKMPGIPAGTYFIKIVHDGIINTSMMTLFE